MSLTQLKRRVEEIEGVESVSIERQRRGGMALEVRSRVNILDDLNELTQEGVIDEFEPVGRFMGSFEYEIPE